MDGRPAQNPDLQSSLAEFFMTKNEMDCIAHSNGWPYSQIEAYYYDLIIC